jgi:hypothetical protein
MIVLDEHHLLAVLREFVTYYNQGVQVDVFLSGMSARLILVVITAAR